MAERIPLYDPFTCGVCEGEHNLDFDFTMAFQPIVDCRAKRIFGYEALVRGLEGQSAGDVFKQVNDTNRYAFDQMCRVKAISLAAQLNIQSMLSINFLPNAIYQPERCIRTTLAAAKQYGFPIEQIMFEFTEVEKINDKNHIRNVVNYYKKLGFTTAMDDFGSGYNGLGLLADFQTSIIKLDMELIRNVDQDPARQAIVKSCLMLFNELNVRPLAEGIETKAELEWLRDAGIDLMQGYLLARPGHEQLPTVDLQML